VTQDVGGLSELRWPSGSVRIQIDELSVGWLSMCSKHKGQILQNIEVLLNECIFNTDAGGRKSAQPPVSNDQTKCTFNPRVRFLKTIVI
jgi:hypothetical protein